MSFERIGWPLHAQRRLAERGITVADVENTIRLPDQRMPDARRPGRWIAQKREDLSGRSMLLRVFYADAGGGDVVVVSAYRTTQIARYWRTD